MKAKIMPADLLEELDEPLSSSDDDSEAEPLDSDEELQEAFARGELKPGLVKLKKPDGPSDEKPRVINNVPVINMKLEQIKLNKKLGWAEKLDIINGMAPLAPEIALQLDEHKTKREREIKSSNSSKAAKKASNGPASSSAIEKDPVHNDFVREMNFYRQAQQAVLQCLPKLKELGIPTKRPDDYFAEMAKSDTHMQKVAKVLHKQQVITERAEKVRKVRQQKKIAKQTQVQVLQEKQKAKKELMESVKKYRKGQKNALDFLDEKKSNNRGKGGKDKPMVNRKRLIKNEKYGYGGKKKGSKWNTRESLDAFDGDTKKGGGKGRFAKGKGAPGKKFGNRPGGTPNAGKRFGGRGGSGASGGGYKFGNRPGGRGGASAGAKRPGKKNRQKMKANNH